MAFPAARSYSARWLLFAACVILGTFIGIFLQGFAATASIFRDVVSFGAGLGKVDLLALWFGFDFGFRMNLGTFLGGVAGLFLVRR
ncbi:MAG: hypothetical protein LBT08_02155 [Synergistaceae bacterium]|jgi:hypothetical protein|nr:hypothetical protein [Synergistaceae bacterium]